MPNEQAILDVAWLIVDGAAVSGAMLADDPEEDVRDGRMRVHLYGTLTSAKRTLHPQERAYRLTQSPPWLMMPSRKPQRGRGRAYRRQRFTWSVL